MPSQKYTSTSGFVAALDEAIKNNATAIQAGGADPAALRARVTAKAEAMKTAETAKDDMVRLAGEFVDKADTAESECYNEGSSVVDVAAGAVGKTTPLGKQLLKIRAQANTERKARVKKSSSTGNSQS